jgi:hypothetical protein
MRKLPPGKEKEILGYNEIVKFVEMQNRNYAQEYAMRAFNESRTQRLSHVDETPEGFKDSVKLHKYPSPSLPPSYLHLPPLASLLSLLFSISASLSFSTLMQSYIPTTSHNMDENNRIKSTWYF